MTALLCITIVAMALAGGAYSFVTPPPFVHFTVKVFADLGANVTMPCMLMSKDHSLADAGVRVKWTKVYEDEALNEDVLLAMGVHKKTYGNFEDRVFLEGKDAHDDASLTILDVSMADMGKYLCEVTNGMTDTVQEVTLEVLSDHTETGVVFPYHPQLGRYSMDYAAAVQACVDQGAVVASPEQLSEAWKAGLDWCNAGWLNDGSVQYPIKNPRGPCGGSNSEPGLRSYGLQNKTINYDVYCFTPAFKGTFYWLTQPESLTFDEAVQACLDDDAEIATVSHIFAAWKLEAYDRCDSGWLADGSVRYPISRPRKNCSPTEAAVRMIGFPDKTQKSYGVYCFKSQQ